jgi:glycosyltransferase involved in cell wall biosynthesis
LLYVGARPGHKNFTGLLQAYASSSRLRVDFDLLAFGGGQFKATEFQELASLKLKPNQVRQVSGSDDFLGQLYARASALVYPSVYEGFGLPALEALAAGVPVVASDIPPLKEVCSETAIYCDAMSIDSIANALSKAATLTEPQHRELTDLGRRQARLFSWEKAAQAYLDIFEEVAAARRRAKV